MLHKSASSHRRDGIQSAQPPGLPNWPGGVKQTGGGFGLCPSRRQKVTRSEWSSTRRCDIAMLWKAKKIYINTLHFARHRWFLRGEVIFWLHRASTPPRQCSSGYVSLKKPYRRRMRPILDIHIACRLLHSSSAHQMLSSTSGIC